MPWLMIRAFVVVTLMVCTVLVLAFVEPAAFKSLCLIPIVVCVLVMLCWIKVHKLYKISKHRYKPPRKPKSPYSHYASNMTRESPYASSKHVI